MFVPNLTGKSFDRNIFNGQGQEASITALNPVSLMFFFAGNIVVGTLTGTLDAVLYHGFTRGEWLPVEIIHEGSSYCGWVKHNEIDLAA